MIDLLWILFFQFSKVLYGVSLNLISPFFLTPKEQGEWFLMISFSAILLLFINTFAHITVLFTAHENKEKTATNTDLYAFLKLNIKIFLIFFIFLSGFIFLIFYFVESEKNILLTFGSYLLAIYLFGISFLGISIVEGLGFIKTSYKVKSIFFLLISSLILILISYLKIITLPVSMFIASLFLFFLPLKILKEKKVINGLKIVKKLKKRKEKLFYNYLLRNGVNMLSGFLLFQVYVPLVYKLKDKVFAGKVGISIALFSAIFSVSVAIINGKLSFISNLVANGKAKKAYQYYTKYSIFSIFLFFALSLGSFYLIYFNRLYFDFSSRFISLESFFILFVAWFFQVLVFIMVMFFRVFKREPFVLLTVFSSIYILISTILILKYLPEKYLFLGFLSSYIFSLPIIYIRFKNFLKDKLGAC